MAECDDDNTLRVVLGVSHGSVCVCVESQSWLCVCVQMSKSVTNVQELGALANNLTHSYSDLAAESCRIALTCPSPQVFKRQL